MRFLVVSLLPLLVAAAPPPGRVSHLEGKLFARGARDAEWSSLPRNALVRHGDELRVPVGSFAELELSGRVFVHVAGGSSLSVDAVDGELVATVFAGAVGVRGNSAALGLRLLGARVAAEPGARLRLDVDRDGARAVVRALEAGARVHGAQGELWLLAGQVLTLVPGLGSVGAWDGQPDAFDRQVAERSSVVLGKRLPEQVTGSYVALHELDGSGRWVRLGTRWAWQPSVAPGWQPYRDGQWQYLQPYGWVWVADAEWGYVTHHYGRWLFDPEYRWVWIADSEWGPAYVTFIVVEGRVGWAPVDWSGAPVMHPEAPCWSFASASYFAAGGGTSIPEVATGGWPSGAVPVADPAVELAPARILARVAERGRVLLQRPQPEEEMTWSRRAPAPAPRPDRARAFEAPVLVHAPPPEPPRAPARPVETVRPQPYARPIEAPLARPPVAARPAPAPHVARPVAAPPVAARSITARPPPVVAVRAAPVSKAKPLPVVAPPAARPVAKPAPQKKSRR